MTILAFEFSSAQRSVAVARRLAIGKAPGLSEVIETGTISGDALGMTQQVLSQAGVEREKIECVAVGLGPGSYHGIRTAIALAQGFQLARGVKLLGISSVECLAAQAQAEGIVGRIHFVIDAQRGEFYVARYDLSEVDTKIVDPLRLVNRTELAEMAASGTVLGPEAPRWIPQARDFFPRAATLARLALDRTDFIAGEKLTPIYLRETSFAKAPQPGQK